MLRLENVSKSYSSGGTKAVDNVSFEVRPGEIFGFLGPNGAGKTTTLKMIVGLLRPDEGNIFVNGLNVEENSLQVKKMISYVPDNHDVYERLTGIEYLNFIGDMYGISKEDRSEKINNYLELFELKNAVNDLIKSYSHGMKQKIVLIGALLNEPEIFILDEPLVGLDPKSAFKLKEIMRERCDAGKSVFFSTHVLEVAEKLCDKIAIISKGQIIACGTIEELMGQSKNKESLENIFLELTE